MDRDGATIVGMTGMPEAALAREIELPYAAICVVVNDAAGRGDSAQAISMDQLVATLDAGMSKVRALLDVLVPSVADKADAIPPSAPEQPPPSKKEETPS
jgi:5'-methylthioadenosine phosphorylase